MDGLRDELASLRASGGGGELDRSAADNSDTGFTNGSSDDGVSSVLDQIGGGGGARRVKELEENVRTKNKQIHRLLEDVEQVLLYSLRKYLHFVTIFCMTD